MRTRSQENAIGCVVVALLLLFALLFCHPARGDGTFSGDNTFTSPGTFTIQSGVTLSGVWNFSGATVTGFTASPGGVNGELQWNNTGVLNGLATMTTDGVDVTTPSSRFYLVDITDPTKKVRLNLTGIPTATSAQIYVSNNSTTVIGDTGAANNFLTAINPTTGVITKARPTISNLTDLSGSSKILGAGPGGAGVVELSPGDNITIGPGNTLNAVQAGLADGDKGDITVASGIWTIDNTVVTYPKIQNVTQNTLLGRISSGSGQVEELTGTQVDTILPVFSDTTAGLVPASGGGTTQFLRADHTFATPAGGGTVTTTGSPFVNSLALFSGTTSITNLHNSLGVAGFLKIGTDDLVTVENAATHRSSIGAGTVTNFSAGDLSPLFTTTETNTTTTPALSFTLTSSVGTHNYLGNNTGSTGSPAWHQINFNELAGTVAFSQFPSNPGPYVLGRESGTGTPSAIPITGGITISGGYLQLAAGGVTNTYLRDSSAMSLIGRSQNSVGDPGDLIATAGTDYVMRESASSIGWGQIATGGIANSAVTLAKIQNAANSNRFLGSAESGSGLPYSELIMGKNLGTSASTVNAGNYATGENQSGFSTDQYINGSRITMPAGSLTVGMMYHCTWSMTKTAAGTGIINYTVRVGTAGTVSDTAAIVTNLGLNGTANQDIGTFEMWAYVRSSGASTVIVGSTRIIKNGTTTGLINTPGQVLVGAANAGSSFNSSSATKIGMSFNGGSGFSGTVGFVQAELIEP